MRINGRCECGRRGCECARADCDHGFLPDVETTDARGRMHTVSPVCPDCRPDVAAAIAENRGDPEGLAMALQARSILKRPRRARAPRQRVSTVWAAAAAEREAARADLR